jgi:hypothetical protein
MVNYFVFIDAHLVQVYTLILQRDYQTTKLDLLIELREDRLICLPVLGTDRLY